MIHNNNALNFAGVTTGITLIGSYICFHLASLLLCTKFAGALRVLEAEKERKMERKMEQESIRLELGDKVVMLRSSRELETGKRGEYDVFDGPFVVKGFETAAKGGTKKRSGNGLRYTFRVE